MTATNRVRNFRKRLVLKNDTPRLRYEHIMHYSAPNTCTNDN
uniref:Uncharacterized protein n=1 Tax=Anguilla anguilla TaxID=7936 RepID=A0A0E9SCT4_ANGAN